MANTERIAWINRTLKEGHVLTARNVAKRFEVSEKTAKRDIEYLRDRCDAPISWNKKRHSYEYERPWNGLDFLDEHSLLSASFIKALLGQLNYVPVVADTLESMFLEQLPEKYRNIVEGIVYDLPQFETIPNELVLEICSSLSKRRCLSISYIKPNDEKSERTIEPRRLVNYSGKWYTVAFDRSRQALRTFALSRFEYFHALDEPYIDDKVSGVTKDTIDKFISSSYGVYMGEPVGNAVLRFYREAASNVRRSVWHPEQKMRDLGETKHGQAVELSLPVHDYPELLGRALRCGTYCEVIGPPQFRQMWVEEIEKMSNLIRNR